MAVTIKQIEATPESYPDLGSPSPPSAAASALDPAMVWQRIESYVAFRWSERDVTWIVEGPGEWAPPLVPAAISATEIWSAGAWTETFDVGPSPSGGLFLPAAGPYRLKAVVGADSHPPESVIEAFARLAEYMGRDLGIAGATGMLAQGGDGVSKAFSRSASWRAAAIQNSGAGDLLRPYRRA